MAVLNTNLPAERMNVLYKIGEMSDSVRFVLRKQKSMEYPFIQHFLTLAITTGQRVLGYGECDRMYSIVWRQQTLVLWNAFVAMVGW